MQDLMTAEVVQRSLISILETIRESVVRSTKTNRCLLVAVSKTKPADLIAVCYSQGQRHFGENYVQELEEKAKYLSESCPELLWHYIGQVQSNKIAKIASVPNLYCVETLESEKHAAMFDKEWAKKSSPTKLRVLVQVNTSGEENKGGIAPSDAPKLAEYVMKNCSNLQFNGFMTIGSFEHSHEEGENPDFKMLFKVREQWSSEQGRAEDSVDLSMGMSDDFEQAIIQGSTSVRVGSKLFGTRVYAKKPESQ
ncbi:unnamed protein product [Caenorhabditis auriculariae]|uniref:Pyridoxal phosphate homeostasis protein n=1 Tax=Caenorhabditis auriculariae TaxID=2777116 RepID=A0A8S1HEZ4_9PELO|nr:unnamed protein product [Caenorhabditis auriculariae]